MSISRSSVPVKTQFMTGSMSETTVFRQAKRWLRSLETFLRTRSGRLKTHAIRLNQQTRVNDQSVSCLGSPSRDTVMHYNAGNLTLRNSNDQRMPAEKNVFFNQVKHFSYLPKIKPEQVAHHVTSGFAPVVRAA